MTAELHEPEPPIQRPLLLLTLLALPLLGWDLGTAYLYDYDEAWNARVAWETLQSGEPLFLRWQGEPFWDKPPLFFWLQAAVFAAFGPGEWQARLPAALCGWGSVLFTWALARRLGGRRAALLAALALLTAPPFLQTARQAMLDVPLTCWLLLAVWGWRRGPGALAVGLGMGAAWLTKGPAALLLLPILAGLGAWHWAGPGRRNPYLHAGLALGALPVLAWYGAQAQRYGWPFFQAHFGYHLLARAAQPLEGHAGTWWYYLWELGARDWPWLVLLPPAIWAGIRHGAPSLFRLGVIWSGAVLLAFSLAQTKLPWYLTPVYPGLAMIVGAAWGRHPSPAPRAWLLAGAFASGVAALAYGRLTGEPLRPSELLPWRGEYAPAFACLAFALAAAALRRRWLRPFAAGAYAACLLLVAATPLDRLPLPPGSPAWPARHPEWLPQRRPFDPRPAARLARERVPPGAALLFLSPFPRPSLLFYADRRVIQADDASLPARWQARKSDFALVPAGVCARWQAALPGASFVGRAGAGSGDYCLLARR